MNNCVPASLQKFNLEALLVPFHLTGNQNRRIQQINKSIWFLTKGGHFNPRLLNYKNISQRFCLFSVGSSQTLEKFSRCRHQCIQENLHDCKDPSFILHEMLLSAKPKCQRLFYVMQCMDNLLICFMMTVIHYSKIYGNEQK